jgi:hypothetical protein
MVKAFERSTNSPTMTDKNTTKFWILNLKERGVNVTLFNLNSDSQKFTYYDILWWGNLVERSNAFTIVDFSCLLVRSPDMSITHFNSFAGSIPGHVNNIKF